MNASSTALPLSMSSVHERQQPFTVLVISACHVGSHVICPHQLPHHQHNLHHYCHVNVHHFQVITWQQYVTIILVMDIGLGLGCMDLNRHRLC
jgi:hypothetical protein